MTKIVPLISFCRPAPPCRRSCWLRARRRRDVPRCAGDAQPLVTPAWLNSHLHDPNLVVLDIRSAIDGGGAEAYAQGAYPGRVHSDYDKAGWRVTRNNVPFMLPTTAELEKLIGDLGIDENSHVVVVPAGVHFARFRLGRAHLLDAEIAGVGKVSILDGGVAAWKAAGYALESGRTRRRRQSSLPSSTTAFLLEPPTSKRIEQNGGATLIDARPASFFLGKEKAPASPAYGHIPGAQNVDSANSTTRRQPAEAASRARRRSPSDVPQGPVVDLLQHRPLGRDRLVRAARIARPRKDVRLYAGSMVEWTSRCRIARLHPDRTKWDDLKKTLGFGS